MPKMYYKRAMMSDRAVEKKAEYLLRCEYLAKQKKIEESQKPAPTPVEAKPEKPKQQIKIVVLDPVIVSFN